MSKQRGSPVRSFRATIIPSFRGLSNDDERQLANLEPAWGKAALFFRTSHRLGHPNGSVRVMSLLDVHRHLEVYRRRFIAGNTLSLLLAVRDCAEENLPLPDWLADAFQQQIKKFLMPGKLRSLDEVFLSNTLPTKTAKKAALARQDWQLALTLFKDAWELVLDDESLTSFDRIAERLIRNRDYGVRKTKVKHLITMIDRNDKWGQCKFSEERNAEAPGNLTLTPFIQAEVGRHHGHDHQRQGGIQKRRAHRRAGREAAEVDCLGSSVAIGRYISSV